MHYSTKDSLKTAIAGLSTSDVLSAGTAYKAYIFAIATETMIRSVTFSTEAELGTAAGPRWVSNTVAGDKLKFTLSIPSSAVLSVQKNESLLLPLYSSFSYSGRSGLDFIRKGSVDRDRRAISCSLTSSCLPNISGYAVIQSQFFPPSTSHLFNILAIESISDAELGPFVLRDALVKDVGTLGQDKLTFTTD